MKIKKGDLVIVNFMMDNKPLYVREFATLREPNRDEEYDAIDTGYGLIRADRFTVVSTIFREEQ